MPSDKKTLFILFCGVLALAPNLAGAMNLVKYNKNVVDVFNEASMVLLSFVSRLVLLILIFGGVYYVMSGADSKKQETAKKIIKYALLGLILILISYALIIALDKIGVR
jgi:RsiW-degrading membrane proteinase PrsW (M82 family)